jgi:hypothetical protein
MPQLEHRCDPLGKTLPTSVTVFGVPKAWMPRPCTPGYLGEASTSYRQASPEHHQSQQCTQAPQHQRWRQAPAMSCAISQREITESIRPQAERVLYLWVQKGFAPSADRTGKGRFSDEFSSRQAPIRPSPAARQELAPPKQTVQGTPYRPARPDLPRPALPAPIPRHPFGRTPPLVPGPDPPSRCRVRRRPAGARMAGPQLLRDSRTRSFPSARADLVAGQPDARLLLPLAVPAGGGPVQVLGSLGVTSTGGPAATVLQLGG